MRTIVKALCILLTLAVALPGCIYRSSSTPYVGGEQITKKYKVESVFCNIDNRSPANIVFTQGEPAKVEAYGDEQAIAELNVLTKDSTLTINMNKKDFRLHAKTRITIHITSPRLRNIYQQGVGNLTLKDSVKVPQLSIQAKGVGNITAEALLTQRLEVYQEGVGSIELEGQAEKARLAQHGVGSLKAKDMIVSHLTVEQHGVGSIACYASQTINIHTQGVGSVEYYGNPQTTGLKKSGIGSITHK